MEEIKQVDTWICATERINLHQVKGETHEWVRRSTIEDVKKHLINKHLDVVFNKQCKITYSTATSAMVGDVFTAKAFHPLTEEGDALISLLVSEEIVFVVNARYWTGRGIQLDLIPCGMSEEVSIIECIRTGGDWYSL